MRTFYRIVLLVSGVMFIAVGVKVNNIFFAVLGGIFLGLYTK